MLLCPVAMYTSPKRTSVSVTVAAPAAATLMLKASRLPAMRGSVARHAESAIGAALTFATVLLSAARERTTVTTGAPVGAQPKIAPLSTSRCSTIELPKTDETRPAGARAPASTHTKSSIVAFARILPRAGLSNTNACQGAAPEWFEGEVPAG